MRADRLLSIMLLLQVHQRMTAQELATRLEVSERTILRDMEALSGAGIPVVAERGPGGGWRLLEGFRTNLTGLTSAEIETLFLPQPSRLLADLGMAKTAEGALIRLRAAVPTMYQRDAEYIRQRIHLDMPGWRSVQEDTSLLPVLRTAIWEERKLQMTYQKGDETVDRVVEPLGLVAKGAIWYLIAAVDGEPRTYRVARIRDATATDETFDRPAGFDLAAFWTESSRRFVSNLPQYPVELRAAPGLPERMRLGIRWAKVQRVDPPGTDGWCRMAIQFETASDAVEYLAGFGPSVEVLEPVELREQLLALAQSLVAFYSLKKDGEHVDIHPDR